MSRLNQNYTSVDHIPKSLMIKVFSDECRKVRSGSQKQRRCVWTEGDGLCNAFGSVGRASRQLAGYWRETWRVANHCRCGIWCSKPDLPAISPVAGRDRSAMTRRHAYFFFPLID